MKITLPKNEKANGDIPCNYYSIVDLSGSMYHSIKELKETILSVNKLIGPNDTLSLAWFSGFGSYEWVCKGAKVADENLQKLVEEKFYARGLTNYTDVLASTDGVINDVSIITGNKQSCLYWLSDGYPNDRSPDSEIIKLCKLLKGKFQSGVICGYGSYYNRPTLLAMADAMGAQMNHISDFQEMKQSYTSFVKGKKSKKNIKIDKKYDIVWQVAKDIVILEQNKDNSVDVFESKENAELFGIDMNELDSLSTEDLTDGTFVYSLAYVLSQQSKANLGVSVLRKAKALMYAKMLQKAFTVSQKGRAENELKAQAILGGKITQQEAGNTIPLNTFVQSIKDNLGQITIDLDKSEYNAISRKGTDVSKVEFETDKSPATIVDVVGNENRANVSFLTVRKGRITKINDKELSDKIAEFNKSAKKKITFPIEADTYRNYTLVANGDFNFDKLAFGKGSKFGEKKGAWSPEKEIDLFDEDVKSVKIKDFVNLYKTLIAEKAHVSVLNMYIKKYAEVKHLEDLRETKYGRDAIDLLKEIGLDYAMRYTPKSESIARSETDDFIPFTELTAQLKGASKISAKDSFEKYVKKGKKNPGDEICWPLFDQYEAKLKSLGKETFVEHCQSVLEGLEKTVDLLRHKVSTQKFYLMVTNSWFEGVEKSDEIEQDGLVIKVKETKEYI